MLFGKGKGTAIYRRKQKTLTINKLDNKTVKLIELLAGDNLKKSGRTTITVDVSKVKDVDTALSMLDIVTKVI